MRSLSKVLRISVQYSMRLCNVTIIKDATLTRSRMEKYRLVSVIEQKMKLFFKENFVKANNNK